MFVDEILLIEGLLLNLVELIEDNILLVILMWVLMKEEEVVIEFLKGNDWEVVFEEEY